MSLAAAFFVTTAVANAAGSPPAFLMASATAVRMPSLVSVAPETASTLRLWASTMRAGICLTAASEMPTVSTCFTTRTAESFPASTLTSTVSSPFLPDARVCAVRHGRGSGRTAEDRGNGRDRCQKLEGLHHVLLFGLVGRCRLSGTTSRV